MACSRGLGVLDGTKLDHQSPSIPQIMISNISLLCGPIRLVAQVRGFENGNIEDIAIAAESKRGETSITSIWPRKKAIINTKIITPIDHSRTRGERYDP